MFPAALNNRAAGTNLRIGRRGLRACLAAGVLLLHISAAQAQAPAAVPAPTPSPCRNGISPETADRLYKILKSSPANDSCAFEGVKTEKSTLEATWSRPGMSVPPVRVTPRECLPNPAVVSGEFVVEVPPGFEAACPAELPLIADLTKAVGKETAVHETGDEAAMNGPLFLTTYVMFALALILTLVLLIRDFRREKTRDWKWVIIGGAGFVVAFAVRAALPFLPANWYSEVLPATGAAPWMRFGPGIYAFQMLLRDFSVWNQTVLVVTQLTLASLAVPIFLGVLRELRLGTWATLAALVLLILAPFHVRVSATSAEHVLASTLALGLFYAWLRAFRTGDVLWYALALLLFPLTGLTRIDMIAQASILACWPLARDRIERKAGPIPGPSFAWRVVMVVLLAAVGTFTGFYVYEKIALPSHHPQPTITAMVYVLRHDILKQYWLLSQTPPGWFSFSAVLLAMVGCFTMIWTRPLLLARIIVSLVGMFTALGRSFMHDELLSARYFLITLPIFFILSGFGFESLIPTTEPKLRLRYGLAGLAALALWTGYAGRNAYQARYAFQDEYAFEREALKKLPPDCTVYQVPIRPQEVPRDVDCCLDTPRTPLVLEFPQLHFKELPRQVSSVFESGECHAYYETSACEIRKGSPEVDATGMKAIDYFQRRCAEARSVGHFTPVAESTASPRAIVDFFQGARPHIGLYLWTH